MSRTFKCPAKINLGLEVLGKRADGYHELRTVFQTIALYDDLQLEVEKAGRRAAVEISCNVAELADSSNLAARAAQAVLRELGVARRVRLTLRKSIPPGGGLGGGSSDAAAVLRTLPGLLGRRLEPERLLAVAAALGADVPFFLVGGRAVGLGRGDEVYPLPDLPARAVVVVHPGLHVSTADAYRRLERARRGALRRPRRKSLTTPAAGNTIFSFCAIVNSCRWNRLKNDFEPVVFSAYPELARLRAALARAGASPALLSGSGSAMFGMFESQGAARRAAAQIRRRWPGWRVWVTRTVSRKELAREWPEHELRPTENF